MPLSRKVATKCAFAAAALAAGLAAVPAAQAAPLSIVDVGAPAVNCVFHDAGAPNCTVIVNDSIGTFTPPGDVGNARLQSRTYPGQAPAPGAGTMAYVYRVDLTSVQGAVAANCVTKLAFDFGAVVPLPYSPKGKADVFVVTQGGLGSVKLASANQSGSTITFTFAAPVCPGATSYFFGLASKTATPKDSKATLSYSLGGGATTAVRVP